MNPAAPGLSSTIPAPTANARPAVSPAELRKKAHARLADRIDLSRSRHKPLSILRAEAKRALEQFFDQETATLSRSDRDRLIEDVLAESIGFGPLEEIFRDDAVKEILIVAPTQVIGRKNDSWLPMSARFRDVEQFRAALARWAEIGESLAPGPDPIAALDVRLPNGFRVVAILPPEIMEHSPQVLFQRGMTVNTPAPSPGAAMQSSVPKSSTNLLNATRPGTAPKPTRNVKSGVVHAPALRPTESGVVSFNTPATTRTSASMSQSGMPGIGPAPAASGPPSQTGMGNADPFAKVRQRVTERIIMKFASAGVYDLNQIPLPELHRIVLAQVAEFCGGDKGGFDETTFDRLSLEILSSMNR